MNSSFFSFPSKSPYESDCSAAPKHSDVSKKIDSNLVASLLMSCCYLNEATRSRNGVFFFNLVALIMFHVENSRVYCSSK